MRYSSVADAFLFIGAAIVKAGLKIWLGEDSAATGVSTSIIDVLKTKISGDLEQRQAQRFFEDLEVPVAKRLRALRESEFRSMPENECTAAVLAAGGSFDRARLTARDLFTRDLDPLFLERHVRVDSRAATRDLSADGTAFYDRLISEGCAYVIEIADKLPHFNAGVFAELLHRDRQILEVITKVLDRIPEKAEGNPGEARFATAYVRHLSTKLDRLELFGLDFESPWYPLSVAYVSLRAEGLDEKGAPNIEDRLAKNQRSMVLGRAGSGKTTVLQWFAVRAARSDFTGALSKLNGHIPFFIRLREYVGRALPSPEEFISSTARMLAAEMPPDWARAQLRSGRAILLIDGVDELPPDERENVVSWLQDLCGLFPDARYIVTARPAAVPMDLLDDLNFRRSSLEAMPPSLVAAFVRHWHDAARHRFVDNDERVRLTEYERSLLVTLDNDRYLRDLADTPLLAGLLCALNHHLRSQLPRRRSEIYGRALSMFDQRDRSRRIVTGDVLLDLTAKTRLLGDLALWMIRNGESEVNAEAVTSLLDRSLSSLPDVTHNPEAVFRVLLERSGLLREPAFGRVDFVHRTFQEYLAAWTAVYGDVIGELLQNSGDDQWREVLVMAAGQANRPQTTQLIQGLLKRTLNASLRIQRHLLAVACLEEVRSLDPKLRRSVEETIPNLLPPRSMEQAEQLSKAGERLIPLLAKNWSRDVSKAAETIRAASLVGGQSALDLIESIAERRDSLNDGAIRESLRAWQYFDPEEYARRILVPTSPDSLIVYDLPRFVHALSQIMSLEQILADPFVGKVDLSPLAILPELDTVAFADLEAGQLQGLAACQQVRKVLLPGYGSESFLGLELSPTTKSLVVEGATRLESLAGTERQVLLTNVSLRDCPVLRDVSALLKLPNLRSVDIHNCKNVADVAVQPGVKVTRTL